MTPPWMIEQLEEERRRRERERDSLRIPLEEAMHEDEQSAPVEEAQRGVAILDISPPNEHAI